ncbi:MAG: WG repeat-containing protein [Pirellulales bacterium]
MNENDCESRPLSAQYAPASRRQTTRLVGAVAIAAGVLLIVGVTWRQKDGDSGPSAVTPKVSATSKDIGPLIYDIPWKAPPPLTAAEFQAKYATYFEPEFQRTQGERIPPDLDVDTLQSVFIRPVNGAPGLGTLFIDRAGAVVLALKYPAVQRFSEGFAAVGTRIGSNRVVQSYGFVDRTGAMVIPPRYDHVEPFHEGLAPVTVDEKAGFIDRQGTMVIRPQYHFVGAFQNGVGYARLKPVESEKVQFIDRQGKVLLNADSRETGYFSEGLMRMGLKGTPGIDDGVAVGYVDSTFSFVFRLGKDSSGFRPGRCEEFHDGMAAVEVERSNQWEWGFINREGKLAVPGPFFKVMSFSEGLAAVKRTREMDDTWGYIDRAGSFVIRERFFKVTSFAEGLAAVLLPLDKPGATDGQSAKSGLPRVKWGYIDQQGQTTIEPRFYEAKPFRHGLAEVKESPRHLGFIDKTGEYVWEMILPGG